MYDDDDDESGAVAEEAGTGGGPLVRMYPCALCADAGGPMPEADVISDGSPTPSAGDRFRRPGWLSATVARNIRFCCSRCWYLPNKREECERLHN
jgi:hypothetical protein